MPPGLNPAYLDLPYFLGIEKLWLIQLYNDLSSIWDWTWKFIDRNAKPHRATLHQFLIFI